MIRRLLPAILLLGTATAARADDDALLPTHLIDGGQAFATATFQYIRGEGDTTLFGTKGDFEQTAYDVQLDAGIGLGAGIEIDASIVGQFSGRTKSDFSSLSASFDSVSRGFSDLGLAAIYRILKDDTTTPQLIIGAIGVAPIGNDKNGQPRITVFGVRTQDSTESGIGDGVWRYGLEAGLSKKLPVLEPYILTSYIFGGKRRENGVNEDRADVWNLTVGGQWHLSPQATIDTRGVFSRVGVDRQEAGGSQVKSELHFNSTVQASLYLHLGSGVTFTLGGGATFVEDHTVNDLLQLGVKDDLVWFIQAGLHILIGSSSK
jgi:hypothetical protein